MKALLKIPAVLLGIILFAQCASNEIANSDTVKQSEIYQYYSVAYNSDEKQLTAFASFRFGGHNGTTLILVKPAGILFEKEKMPYEQNIFSGAFYEVTEQTGVKPIYTFMYTDCDKKSYTNRAMMIPVEIIKYPKIADKNVDFSVEWTYPLQAGETINLFVEDSSVNTASVYNNAVGSTSMKINPEELKNLKPGKITIYLVRENSRPLENGTHLGGTIYVKYTSRKIETLLIGPQPVKEEIKKDSIKG